jgi:hypothetical protein
MTPSEQHQAGAEAASELLARRAQLQEWLHRLDRVEDEIPVQVKRRVRADYEQRLAEVVTELSEHSEALSADREQLDETLLAAAERHDRATDALEEARLRHLIGELSSEEWESRRPDLETEVEAARADREATETEIRALDDLLSQLGAAAAAPEAESEEVELPVLGSADEETVEAPSRAAAATEPEAEPTAEDFADEAEEWVPDLPEIETPADWGQPVTTAEVGEAAPDQLAEREEPSAAAEEELPIMGDPMDVSSYESEEKAPANDDLVEITTFAAAAEALADEVETAPADDDYAFLEELDRAIAATAPSGSGSESDSREEEPQATRPQPGLKCPDCGYSNDPAAWYCGVCGVDLG